MIVYLNERKAFLSKPNRTTQSDGGFNFSTENIFVHS